VADAPTPFTLDRPLIFLIGYRGTGKTTVAPALAARLGWGWIDADEVLERRYGSIQSLFQAEGEVGFRDKEAAVLAGLCKLQRHVISAGGGAVLRPECRELLRAHGRSVWLTAEAGTLWQRTQADVRSAGRRPKLTVGGIEEVVELLKQREALYRACADLTVSTEGHSPEQVVADIVAGLAGFAGTPDPGAKSEPEA
jgi:shikimate kinase